MHQHCSPLLLLLLLLLCPALQLAVATMLPKPAAQLERQR
jgi:hypothetical protein